MASFNMMESKRIEALRAYNASELPMVERDVMAEAAMKDRMFEGPAELYQAPKVYVCSVWPRRVISQPFSHGGVGARRYYIEPGSPENPSILALYNTYYLTQTIGDSTDTGGFRVGYQPSPVYAIQIAKNIIEYETGNHPGNVRGKKGIGVISGPQPTPAEINELAHLQVQFLTYIVERADAYDDAGQRLKIGPEHRDAFDMLGLDELQHKWRRNRVQQYNSCPACAERILLEARVCKVCHTDLVKFFMEANEVPSSEQWPMVAKAIDKLTASKGKENQ